MLRLVLVLVSQVGVAGLVRVSLNVSQVGIVHLGLKEILLGVPI
jgi:hypothetical protein